MTFRSWPWVGSATSTLVVFDPMSIAAQSILGADLVRPNGCGLLALGPPGPWSGRRLGLDDLARVGGVLELAEQPGDEEGDLLADVHCVVADPLQRPGNEHHRHRPLASV